MPRHRLTTYAVLIRFLSMCTVWVLLFVWSLNASRMGCLGVLAVFAFVSAAVLLSSAEDTFLHHRAMVSACMRREAKMLRLIHGRALLLVRQIFLSAALTLALLVAVLLLEPRQWSLIFVDLLLLTLLLPKLTEVAGRSVRSVYRFAMARHWATWLSIGLIWAESLLSLIYAPSADFTGQRWQAVVAYEIQPPDVACGIVGVISDVAATAQGLALWAVQNFGRAMHIPTESTIAWLGLLVVGIFPFIFAYALSRALVGTMARPWEMWEEMIDDFRSLPRSSADAQPGEDRRAEGRQ
jgi:hypothetical protein